MTTYKFSNNDQLQSFPVMNVFIDQYMPKANATFVKVYLYVLRHCYSNNNQLANDEIAKALHILESDVVNAWLYWESEGVVRLIRAENEQHTNFDVEFIDLTSEFQAAEKKQATRIILDTKPNYSTEEIAIYIENDGNIRHMYDIAQTKLGKMLSSADIKTLYSFYDWLRLPIEVIVMLLEYCVSINKKNMRYIEKVAINWADLGIDSMEKAETYLLELEKRNSILYQIKKHFGIHDRSLIGTEENYITTWTETMEFNIELIQMAYDITVTNTGKLAFPYLNSILESWYKNGIKTIDAVKTEQQNFKQNNSSNQYHKKQPNKNTSSNNKFINFTQRKYDFEELEKIALQKSMDQLKESR